MKHIFIGDLRLKDDLNAIDYYTYNPSKIESKSITDRLDYIYNSGEKKSKKVYLSIKYKNKDSKENRLITREGILNRNKDKFGVLSYFVDNYPFELELDELVGTEVEVTVEDNLKAEDWEVYDARNS